MSVRLLFPTFVFHRNFLDPNLDESQGYDLEYAEMLVNEVDEMRKRDPKGRDVSNRSNASVNWQTGWQSNDGCESNPIFTKCMNRITRFFQDEVLPFHGMHHSTGMNVRAGNSWANINEKGSFNAPHTHNGCWYSGVLYLKADGDEGDFVANETSQNYLGIFPHHQRVSGTYHAQPRTGDIHLFPSGLMHMVEPNYTDKARYSISFNMDMHDVLGSQGTGNFNSDFSDPDYNGNEFVFNLDERGNPIR